jgi:hypothetical protein
MQVRDLALGREFWIADPDPHEAVFLGDGIRACVKIFSYTLLSGHPDALAAFVEFETVIFANQMFALQIAHRERQEAVRAAILEAGDRSVHLAIEHDGLAADGAREWRVLDF